MLALFDEFMDSTLYRLYLACNYDIFLAALALTGLFVGICIIFVAFSYVIPHLASVIGDYIISYLYRKETNDEGSESR